MSLERRLPRSVFPRQDRRTSHAGMPDGRTDGVGFGNNVVQWNQSLCRSGTGAAARHLGESSHRDHCGGEQSMPIDWDKLTEQDFQKFAPLANGDEGQRRQFVEIANQIVINKPTESGSLIPIILYNALTKVTKKINAQSDAASLWPERVQFVSEACERLMDVLLKKKHPFAFKGKFGGFLNVSFVGGRGIPGIFDHIFDKFRYPGGKPKKPKNPSEGDQGPGGPRKSSRGPVFRSIDDESYEAYEKGEVRTPLDDSISKEFEDAYEQCKQGLTEEERKLWDWYEPDDKSYAEIARILGKSEVALRTQIHRIRRKIGALLIDAHLA